MFDTLNIKMNHTTVGVQTKNFDCTLETFDWLDPVRYDAYTPSGAFALTEDSEVFGRKIWVSFIFMNGIYVDYSVSQHKKEAQEASKILNQIWSDPELQMLVMTSCAQTEKLKNDSHALAHNSLQKFFLDYQFTQTHKDFCDKYFAGTLTPLEKLSNSHLYGNLFLDMDQQKYISLKAKMKDTIDLINEPVLKPEDEEKIKKIIDNFPLPLPYTSTSLSEAAGEDFISMSGIGKYAPLPNSVAIYEAKQQLLKNLYNYSLKKIAKQENLIQNFLFSRLFNSNPHPVFQKALGKIENATLDYETYYDNDLAYLAMSGETYEVIKGRTKNKSNLEKFILKNTSYVLGSGFLDNYYKEFQPSFEYNQALLQSLSHVLVQSKNKEDGFYGDINLVSTYTDALILVFNHTNPVEREALTVGADTIAGLLLKAARHEEISKSHQKNAIKTLEAYAEHSVAFSTNQNENLQIIADLSTNEVFKTLFVACEAYQLKEGVGKIQLASKGRIKKI